MTQLIESKVVDEVTGSPVAGITVQVISQKDQSNLGGANTDPNGEFTVYLDNPIGPGDAFVTFLDPSGKYDQQDFGDASQMPATIPMTPETTIKPVPVWVWIAAALAIAIIVYFVYKHFKK